MEGQFNLRFEIEMELELIEVDLYRFLGSFNHFVGPMKLLREMANK